MDSKVKERGIVLHAHEVRGVLDGRQTQIRRVVKPQPDDDAKITMGEIGTSLGVAYIGNATSGGIVTRVPCPYGRPGERLWVKETFAIADSPKRHVEYAADGRLAMLKYSPSIHMPRWASRITLEITGVRVERLQGISNEDAVSEGIGTPTDIRYAALDGFKPLWKSINGPGSWDLNPWVWVIEFRRL